MDVVGKVDLCKSLSKKEEGEGNLNTKKAEELIQSLGQNHGTESIIVWALGKLTAARSMVAQSLPSRQVCLSATNRQIRVARLVVPLAHVYQVVHPGDYSQFLQICPFDYLEIAIGVQISTDGLDHQ